MGLSRLSEKPHIFRRMTNAQRVCGCDVTVSSFSVFMGYLGGRGRAEKNCRCRSVQAQ